MTLKELVVAVVLGWALVLTARADIDPDGATHAGSGAMQEKVAYCTSWARFAGRVYDGRSFGIPQEHFLGALLIAASPDAEGVKVLTYVIGQSYNWPTADDRLQGWIFSRCMKDWPKDDVEPEAEPEAAPEVEPESNSQSEPVTFGFMAVKGQKFYCDAVGAVAESMDDGFRNSEFKPEHIVNEHQRRIADLAIACRKANEPIRECSVRRCLEQHT